MPENDDAHADGLKEEIPDLKDGVEIATLRVIALEGKGWGATTQVKIEKLSAYLFGVICGIMQQALNNLIGRFVEKVKQTAGDAAASQEIAAFLAGMKKVLGSVPDGEEAAGAFGLHGDAAIPQSMRDAIEALRRRHVAPDSPPPAPSQQGENP